MCMILVRKIFCVSVVDCVCAFKTNIVISFGFFFSVFQIIKNGEGTESEDARGKGN